ncbi:MAG TPA: hypothetical protein VI431_08680 [Candidatus Acidoferrum sp.]
MRKFLLWSSLLLFFANPGACLAQTTCKRIADAEQKLYGFRSAKLSDPERKQKSAAMDSFWQLVKSSGQRGVACLRPLLEKQTDTFAVFDEASLLYSLDRSPESLNIVARAVARTDLADVQPADYVRMGLVLAKQGLDTEPIGRNYINAKSDVTAYLPEHGAYRLDRVAGAILLFGVLPTDKIDDALSAEVKSDNTDTRNAAAIVWSLNMTARSFKGLADLGEMKDFSEEARRQVHSTLIPFTVRVSTPKYTREQMLAKIAKFPEMDMDPSEDFERENKALDNSVYATFTAADVETLRESRRKLITGVSNESVESYAEMSRVLLHLINKLGLYAEYRTRGQAPAPVAKP